MDILTKGRTDQPPKVKKLSIYNKDLDCTKAENTWYKDELSPEEYNTPGTGLHSGQMVQTLRAYPISIKNEQTSSISSEAFWKLDKQNYEK